MLFNVNVYRLLTYYYFRSLCLTAVIALYDHTTTELYILVWCDYTAGEICFFSGVITPVGNFVFLIVSLHHW